MNKIIIITAPSGSGKTTIIRHLLAKFPQLAFSISATTRPPRGQEVNGKDYYFISETDFKQKVAANEFAEWEMVYEGRYYGTLHSELERMWQDSKVPVLDIDVKGAVRVQQHYSDSHLSIFIEPPSIDELKRRLETRGTESAEAIAARVAKAAYELSFKDQFNHVVTNDNLQSAIEKAEKLIINYLGI